MAIKFPDYQKTYTERFEQSHGLPIAEVIMLGTGRWITVCPCCGMAHDVTTFAGEVYTPRCTSKTTHPTVYAKWRKAHPDAAAHVSVWLQRPQELPNETIITTAKPVRRAA